MRNTTCFRRILASILVGGMLIGGVASCAKPGGTVTASGITVVTDEASKYADWLAERLDNSIPDKVVVGIGSDKGYKVDMEAFEDLREKGQVIPYTYMKGPLGGDFLGFFKEKAKTLGEKDGR